MAATVFNERSAQGVGVSTRPHIRQIGTEDIRASLREGWSDFLAMPSHVLFVVVFYPIIGLILATVVFGNDAVRLLFPLMSGFALIGPFAAIGLYELSRRREQGLDTSFRYAFRVFRTPAVGPIVALGIVLFAIFAAWLIVAEFLYGAFFPGAVHATYMDFFREVLTTPHGWALIVVGNLVGFAFALLTLAVTAVSFPLLLDREDVGVGTAMGTSVRLMQENPRTMLAWGFIVAVVLALGSIPLFVGLAVALPLLGHATWHLYRRAVEA